MANAHRDGPGLRGRDNEGALGRRRIAQSIRNRSDIEGVRAICEASDGLWGAAGLIGGRVNPALEGRARLRGGEGKGWGGVGSWPAWPARNCRLGRLLVDGEVVFLDAVRGLLGEIEVAGGVGGHTPYPLGLERLVPS